MSDVEINTLQPTKITKPKSPPRSKQTGSPKQKSSTTQKKVSKDVISSKSQKTLDALKKEYDENKCMIPSNLYSEQCNKFLLKRIYTTSTTNKRSSCFFSCFINIFKESIFF